MGENKYNEEENHKILENLQKFKKLLNLAPNTSSHI